MISHDSWLAPAHATAGSFGTAVATIGDDHVVVGSADGLSVLPLSPSATGGTAMQRVMNDVWRAGECSDTGVALSSSAAWLVVYRCQVFHTFTISGSTLTPAEALPPFLVSLARRRLREEEEAAENADGQPVGGDRLKDLKGATSTFPEEPPDSNDRLEDLADVDSFIGHRHEPSKDGDNHRKLLMHVHTGLSHAHSPHTPAGYVDISISCSPASEAPPDPIGCEECLPVECDPGYKRQGLCNTHLGDLPTIPGVTYGDVARTCAAVSLRSGWRLPLSLCTTLPLTVPVDPTIPS